MRNRPITEDHFDRILRASSADERALWILASETGFRIGDLLKIRQWQVPKCSSGLPMASDRSGLTEPDRMTLTLRESKTGHKRTTELTERAVTAMQWTLNNCPERHPFRSLFPARLRSGAVARKSERESKASLHRSTAYRHFSSAVKRAGLYGLGYTVHSLRKMYARKKYNECGSLLEVQRDLGHANLSTTMLYVSDLKL